MLFTKPFIELTEVIIVKKLTVEELRNKFTAGVKSTGLEMAIVKKIIDAYKVQINVQSEVDKDTDFRLSLLSNLGNSTGQKNLLLSL